MSRPPRIPLELTHGPFRGSHAIASGSISRRMLNGPEWRRLLPDVYAHRDTDLDHRAWCVAVMLTAPAEVAIGGPSAACLWGVAALRAPTPVSVVAPRTYRSRRERRIAVHYTSLGDTDTTSLAGLRVTTPERTAFDVGRRAGRADALVVLDAMLHRHLLDREKLRQMLGERSGWPRAGRLAELLLLAEPRSESPMESRLRLLLVDAGMPPAAVQFEVRNAVGTLLARVDLAWPELRLAVEYDGDQHREREQFRRDVERLNNLRMAGWTVLRFTADDVLRRPGATARMVIAAVAELAVRPAPVRPAGWPGSTPDRSGSTPGQSVGTPGQSGSTPGRRSGTPGQSGSTPGRRSGT